MTVLKNLFLILFIGLTVIAQAQKNYVLVVESKSSSLTHQNHFSSPEQRSKELNHLLIKLHDDGFLSASYSITEQDSLRLKVIFDPGKVYHWIALKKGNLDERVLSESGFRDKFYKDKPFRRHQLHRLEENILTWSENNGYPFAAVGLDSVQLHENGISANLSYNKNILIKIDSLVNRGNAEISESYLQAYLGIRPGDLYNEARIKAIERRLKELPFVRERIPFRVLFPGENAKIELFLERKKASRFDGILGLLPDAKTGKVRLTGDVRLLLINSFRRAERIELNWKSLQSGTQDLLTGLLLPNLFNSPIGTETRLKLYKRDSTYLETNPYLGFIFHLSGNNFFKVYLDNRQLSLLNSSQLKNLTTLPPWADLTSNLYGLGIHLEDLDYRYNPRKGYNISVNTGAGVKKIHINDQLDANLYQGLDLNSTQYRVESDVEWFVPWKNRSTLLIANKSAVIKNDQLFQNELYRIGGLKSIRGFDEESIFASMYSIFSLEYRFILEENSYLSLFSDAAYYENQSHTFTGDRYDTPYSFGAGISFETRAGIFSLNYALGSQQGNPIDMRAGKVHFGLLNFF